MVLKIAMFSLHKVFIIVKMSAKRLFLSMFCICMRYIGETEQRYLGQRILNDL